MSFQGEKGEPGKRGKDGDFGAKVSSIDKLHPRKSAVLLGSGHCFSGIYVLRRGLLYVKCAGQTSVLILRSLKDTLSKIRTKEVFSFLSVVFLHLQQQLEA